MTTDRQATMLVHAPRALLVLALASSACGVRPAPDPDAPAVDQDIHSYARPAQARVTHLDLELVADFQARRLSGTATLDLERGEGGRHVTLDTRDLDIHEVTGPEGRALEYTLGASDPVLGRPLRITLPPGVRRIEVHYATRPHAAAVQWLEPRQTAGGEHPFLFTQGQAILTRTWIPTQDSPGIRQTYDAAITVPDELTAVMSAEMLTPEGEPTDSGSVYRFRMEEPIPPYLIALAVGDLEFRTLGPRSGVYAEPSVVADAAHEFADVEAMIDAAEELYGPYRWGRYDLLVLPPSFPFGGMENPRLTFATPTILAGDRSLVSLVAHELAHSWSGNLVTNATWRDFWLNEGFTTYIEYRIMEEVYGPEYAAMLRQLGRQDLEAALAELPPADQVLHVDLAGRDPDDGMTIVPYEKGAAFLHAVEEAVGRERFDAFLRDYFQRHAFAPMTTARFVAVLDSAFFADAPEQRAALGVEAWLYEPGLPANAPAVAAERFARVEEAARAFEAGGPPDELPTAEWSTHEWLHFLRGLPAELPEARMAALDRAFRLTETENSEILFAWLRMAIRNRYEPAFPALERFLTSQGRRKFLEPLYRELAATDQGREMARRIYREARPGYHAVSTSTVDAILDWQEAGGR
ncbi:MAG: M1 family metallopeptidase [Gemmatimonadota bacterium]